MCGCIKRHCNRQTFLYSSVDCFGTVIIINYWSSNREVWWRLRRYICGSSPLLQIRCNLALNIWYFQQLLRHLSNTFSNNYLSSPSSQTSPYNHSLRVSSPPPTPYTSQPKAWSTTVTTSTAHHTVTVTTTTTCCSGYSAKDTALP